MNKRETLKFIKEVRQMVAENGGWSAGWLQDMGLKASMVRSWKARKRVPKPWELVLRDRLARDIGAIHNEMNDSL